MSVRLVNSSHTPTEATPLRVLLVERHRFVAQCLSRLVVQLGSAEIAAQVHTAKDALDIAAKILPDIAIIDLDLSPDGSLVRHLHRLCPDTRIVVLAERARGDAPALVAALAAGASGVIYKEDSMEELTRALSSSFSGGPVIAQQAAAVLLQSYVDAMAERQAKVVATIEALAAAVEMRDTVTGTHVRRVCHLATSCMERIDSDLAHNEEVRFGFTLHDVGKIGVPDAILNKPGPLDEDEWAVMQQHPEMGAKIVEPIGLSRATTDIILFHHERWNGSGYPNGLKGEDIPLTARAFAIADSYDAMTSDRPYRPRMSHTAALHEITSKAGTLYDPKIVEAFVTLTE